MGTCIYCKKPAGLLRSEHPECALKHSGALKRARSELAAALRTTVDFAPVQVQVQKYSDEGYLTSANLTDALVTEWERAVERFLEDGNLDTTEEHRLASYAEQFGLAQADLDRGGAMTRLAQAGAIRELLEGRVPQRMKFDGDLPINLQKNELVVWAFRGVALLEDKTLRSYVGQSQGVSIRVMKGLYYRAGAYKGHPVDQTVRLMVDRGMVVVTTKHIYFVGPTKSLRIPYPKIVAFHPFSDGLGIVRDGTNAKMQVLQTGDGWFIHNLVANLARLQSDA